MTDRAATILEWYRGLNPRARQSLAIADLHCLAKALSAYPVTVDAGGVVPTLEQQVSRIFNNERARWWNSLTDAQRALFMRDGATGKDEAFKAGARAALAHTAPVAGEPKSTAAGKVVDCG